MKIRRGAQHKRALGTVDVVDEEGVNALVEDIAYDFGGRGITNSQTVRVLAVSFGLIWAVIKSGVLAVSGTLSPTDGIEALSSRASPRSREPDGGPQSK